LDDRRVVVGLPNRPGGLGDNGARRLGRAAHVKRFLDTASCDRVRSDPGAAQLTAKPRADPISPRPLAAYAVAPRLPCERPLEPLGR
jgi:hypothetical protein